MAMGKFYRAPAPRRMNRRRTNYVPKSTKRYVDKKVKKASWSKEMVTAIDFDNKTLGGYNGYLLTYSLVDTILKNSAAIFENGSRNLDTDGNLHFTLKIKIDYIKWQFRYELGSSETTDAIDQVVREIIYRADDQYEEINSAGTPTQVADDYDGNIKYPQLYGGVHGLYSDRLLHIKSQSADSDTTVPGMRISKGFKRLKYIDTLTATTINNSYPTQSDVKSEKGQLCLDILANDPEGVNGKMYGYFEIGWRFLMN